MIAERARAKPKKPTKNCNAYYPSNNSKRNNESLWKAIIENHTHYHKCRRDSNKDKRKPFSTNRVF